jgi:hypothetical protein
MPNPDSLHSATKAKSYATAGALGANVDLRSEGGTLCRRIRVATGGNLVVTMADGVDVTIYTLLDGESVDVQASAIKSSGTTAQKITVFW